MIPRHSEIFEAYLKIADDQDKKEVKVDFSNPYDLFPDRVPLLQQAHPETVVVHEAYDAMNGVVENDQERQNVMVMIARKNPRVVQTNFFYAKAQEDLLNQTIKLGFLLDSKNDNLAAFADECSNQLTKEAGAPLIIAGIALVSLLGGAFYSNKNPEVQGLKQDSQKALDEIQEAINDYPQLALTLNPYTANIRNLLTMVDGFTKTMDGLTSSIMSISSDSDSKEKAKKIGQFADNLFSSKKIESLKNLAKKIKDVGNAVLESSHDAKLALSSAREKYEEKESTFMSYIRDAWYKAVNSDTEDAVLAIDVLVRSITKFYGIMDKDIAKIETIKSETGIKDEPENGLEPAYQEGNKSKQLLEYELQKFQ